MLQAFCTGCGQSKGHELQDSSAVECATETALAATCAHATDAMQYCYADNAMAFAASPKQLCRQYAVFQLRPTPWPTFGSSAAAVASAVCLPVKFSGLSLHIIMVFLHDASWVLEMTSNITETAIEELQVTLEKKCKA